MKCLMEVSNNGAIRNSVDFHSKPANVCQLMGIWQWTLATEADNAFDDIILHSIRSYSTYLQLLPTDGPVESPMSRSTGCCCPLADVTSTASTESILLPPWHCMQSTLLRSPLPNMRCRNIQFPTADLPAVWLSSDPCHSNPHGTSATKTFGVCMYLYIVGWQLISAYYCQQWASTSALLKCNAGQQQNCARELHVD